MEYGMTMKKEKKKIKIKLKKIDKSIEKNKSIINEEEEYLENNESDNKSKTIEKEEIDE